MNGRIKYIDALRGFAMFLIVFLHIESYGIGISHTIVNDIFLSFRLPVFFLISGFVGYKALHKWKTDKNIYYNSILRKAIVLLTPTIVFFIIYYSLHNKNPWITFSNYGFGFFWCTYVLFLMLFIYYSVCACLKKYGDTAINIAMIIISLIFISGMAINKENKFWVISNFPNLMLHFQFFTLGTILRQYYHKTKLFFQNNTVISLNIVFYIICLYLIYDSRFLQPESIIWMIFTNIIKRYLGLAIVFSIFLGLEDYFNKDSKLSKIMCFTGTRTLDIYLLHWFFIPYLPMLAPLFIESKNSSLEIVIIGILSIIVMALCMVTSSVIRNSEFLGHYLFGAKSLKYKY